MARKQRLYPVLITRRKRATNRAFITRRKQPENHQQPIIFGSVGRARNKLTYLKTHAEETAKDGNLNKVEQYLRTNNGTSTAEIESIAESNRLRKLIRDRLQNTEMETTGQPAMVTQKVRCGERQCKHLCMDMKHHEAGIPDHRCTKIEGHDGQCRCDAHDSVINAWSETCEYTCKVAGGDIIQIDTGCEHMGSITAVASGLERRMVSKQKPKQGDRLLTTRLTLKQVAESKRHQTVHYPAILECCETCMKFGTRDVRHTSGSYKRVAEKPNMVVTIDHMYMLDKN